MKNDGLLGATSEGPQKPVLKPLTHDLLPKVPPAPIQAKAMISMFMLGGPSQIDLFDPKPALYKWHGKSFEGDIKFDNAAQASREIMAPLWKYRNHGQCGMELSELLPHLGGIADDITLIRSMHTGVNNHLPSNYAMTTGQHRGGRAVLGSWLLHALGSETQELPAYVALTDPRGLPLLGGENWSNGPLPSIYQGTLVRPKTPRIFNLEPAPHLRGEAQKRQLSFLRDLNQSHLETHPGEADMEARLARYGLAANNQTAAK